MQHPSTQAAQPSGLQVFEPEVIGVLVNGEPAGSVSLIDFAASTVKSDQLGVLKGDIKFFVVK
jgi:hypothetical protein